MTGVIRVEVERMTEDDENERITLRLERDNLERIDAFLEDHPDFRNRSQLCRDAVQTFIENVTQGGNTVRLKIPTRILETIDHLVSDGHYNDREDAIVQAVRDHFDTSKLQAAQKHREELAKAKGERIELRMGDRDEVLTG